MIHPTREEWMSYLYDELEPQPRRAAEQHLAECPECRAQLNGWQGTGKSLRAYAVSAGPAPRVAPQPWLRWTATAAAAAIVLTAGVAIGRSTNASRSELAGLRDQVAALAKNYSKLRTDTQQQLALTGSDIDRRFQLTQAQQASDYASLRKELETVAVLTEANFQRTENKLVQLAGN